jgi:WD40 repeat protein
MLIITSKEALAMLDGLLDTRSLTQIQEFVFDRAWEGDSYAAIAERSGYDEDYIKAVGARLWRSISQLLNIRVSKNNLRSAFGQYARNSRETDNNIGLKLGAEIEDLERVDWGEAPDLACFYGRQAELDRLTQWISIDKCKLVALLGMGGIGKTTALAQLASQLADTQEFEYIIWRSLRNAPPLERLLADLILFLSNRLETTVEINILIQQLRTSRCLVILDNWETILDPDRMGEFRSGYEGYSELLELIGTTAHRSCVAITSRERPAVLMPLEGVESKVQILRLQGSSETVSGILADRDLQGTGSDLAELGDRYSNNPLAMKIVATSIGDLFNRDVRAFLNEDTLAFSGIRRLLDRQFQRFSALETSVMYWLAINRDDTTLAELDRQLVPSLPKGKILEILESLYGRSLIEQNKARFTQQPVVMEYVTDRLIETAIAEICQQAPQILFTHALIEAQAPEYIRASQRKLILTPLLDRLASKLGDRSTLIHLFHQNLALLQPQNRSAAIDPLDLQPLGYGAGNFINLLCHLQADLTGANLSGLTIRQAYLHDTSLQQVNFTNVNSIQCAFAEALSDVYGLAFSPNGTLVAMVGITGILSVYRVTTGEWLYAIAAHGSVSMGVVFDSAGTSLFTCSFDRQICQWDAATGNCLRSWQTDSSMWDIALSPDEKYLASGHENSTIQIWDLQTLEQIHILSKHGGMVTSIDFHSQLPLLVSSSIDGTFKLWDYQTGKCLKTATAHTNIVWEVKFQPQGTSIASVSNDGLAKLWNLDLECLHTFEVGIVLGHPIAFSPDGQIFACGCTDAKIRLWDVESGRLVRVLPSGRNLWNIIFSPDGRTVVSSSDAAQVKFWDVRLGQCTKTLQGECINFWSIGFNPQGTLLASGGDDLRVRLWDVASGKCLQTLTGHTGRIATVLFHPHQPLLASCSFDGTIKLWDLQGRCLQTLVESAGARIQKIAFHPTQPLLLSGGYEVQTRLWDLATGRSIGTLDLPDDDAVPYRIAFAFNPPGNLLASGNGSGLLLLWDFESGALIWQSSAHQMPLWTLDFHPDGHLIASGGHDGTVKLWDTATGECVKALDGFNGKVMSVNFSQNGTLLAISCESIVQIWDLATQTPIRTLTGHTKLIYSSTFDPSRPNILVSAGDDGTIREWNITTGECLQVLRPDRIYEGMNIAGAIGFSEGQRATLKGLGAVD